MRNVPSRPGGPAQSAPAAIPGGAMGVPAQSGEQFVVPPKVGSFAGRGPGPKPKRFRVVNGGQVVFNGCRTTLRAGKEVADNTYDIGLLRKMGIKLEPIVDEEPEQPPPPAEPQTA